MEPVRYVVETASADGIIISRTEPDDPRVRYLTQRGFPFATHGRTDMGIVHPFNDFDNHAFALEAVRKLASAGRRKLALLAPPTNLTYHYHTVNGFADGLIETGATAIPFNSVSIDHSIDQIRTHTADLMRRRNRPDGIVSSAGAATFAVVGGIEDAGLTVGRDIDVVSKQSSPLLHLFRPALFVVNEDFRRAGRELARSVLGWIDGTDPASLQSLNVPTTVEAAERVANRE
jgi:LacI family transcriptional regulator